MTKKELIRSVSDSTRMTRKTAEKAVWAALEAITAELVSGKAVQLLGFGTFEIKERAARLGRNPQTGESIRIPATKVIWFKAGKTLKKRITQ